MEPLRPLLQRLQLGGDEAWPDALLELAPDPHALRPCVQPQRHRVGGHPPVAAHQHHAGIPGGGGQFIEPGAAGKGFGDIVVQRRRGLGEWLAGPLGVGLRGGDGGGQAGDRPFPGGTPQTPRRLQQARGPFLGVGEMRVQRREGVLQTARTLEQFGGIGIHRPGIYEGAPSATRDAALGAIW